MDFSSNSIILARKNQDVYYLKSMGKELVSVFAVFVFFER